MSDLNLYGRRVDSIFQLLGERENDMSFSVGWAFARSSAFLRKFVLGILGCEVDAEDVVISLQDSEPGSGITDIELKAPGKFHVIVEAKRGWSLPSRQQLERYVKRPSFTKHDAPLKRVVALTECSRDFAQAHLEAAKAAGVQVEPVSWKEVATLAEEARIEGSNAEKRLLSQLTTYLGGIVKMQNLDSNWVYVVAVASGTPKGWGISWIDIVRMRQRYFHPVGGRGWPKQPPNYIAFRYHGRLQSIHHIDSYEVITNPHQRFREIPSQEWGPFFLYTLGPAFGPGKEVRTGKIYPNGRVWCMLDTLFTSETISEARDISKSRMT